VGSALIDSPISKLAFTGGVEVGRRVAEHCGRNLLECVLELGGKAPLIVCDDADLERAAKAIVWGGFANMGQACVSVERVLVFETVYERLVELVKEEADQVRQGSPEDGVFDVGCVVLETGLERTESLVRDAIQKGATLLSGGTRIERPGRYFSPTVLSDCSEQMDVMSQEIFGPIVPLMKVAGESEALRIANSLPYGLSSYVFSNDRKRALRLARRIEAGSVVINDVQSDISSPEVPFGGVKASGYGRIHGEEGLRSMCHIKHVSVNRAPLPTRSPFWFPYTEATLRQAKKGLKLLYGGKALLGRLL
jgi:succinate-semialdehyde dehydrogenase/glutarate-semialdehyde dehydrogenase